MLSALIAGERDPLVLAELARGRMRTKRAALTEALTGRFDDYHAELANVLLSQIDGLSAQIEHLDTRIAQLIADIPPLKLRPADLMIFAPPRQCQRSIGSTRSPASANALPNQ